MSMERYTLDTVVVGAGVVGLAVARALAMSGRKVWVLDKEDSFGRHTSSRNSEVIHAGIYYQTDSLKAKLCVRGKQLLYEYMEERSVPFARCGKLIAAADSAQAARLSQIASQARANHVDDLEQLSVQQLRSLAPELTATSALLSPSTGIVDSHAYMQCLLNDAEMFGAMFLPNTEVAIRSVSFGKFELELLEQNTLVECSELVNASGLFAGSLLSEVSAFPKECLPEPVFAKGSYFSYSGKVPFKQLIYPVPEDGGLGVHLTLDLSGAARFGPDVEWVNIEGIESLNMFDYSVNEAKKQEFVSRIKAYWPAIDASKLHADYSGLRPKIRFNNELYSDFCIQSEQEHGIKGLVNLFGIESPGLTASLAIAELVEELL
jgi:L-2-hydroxyglutarate oxidase LhgO